MASLAGKKGLTVTIGARKSSADSLPDSGPARLAPTMTADTPTESTEAFHAVQSRDTLNSSLKPGFTDTSAPGDVGFGYIDDRSLLKSPQPGNPLKSAMRLPGAAPRDFDNAMKSPTFAPSIMLSPTWREEKILERKELKTDKEQAHDLKVKVRVRIAKLLLRFTNFSCSLIVLAMLTATLTVFNATVHLPPRNALPPWSPNTPRWPQILMLVVACVSLFCSVIILFAYWKGGHKRVQKWQTYYNIVAVAFFTFSIFMWAISAGIFQHIRNQPAGDDLWGWSCKQNTREQIFGESVDYQLLCRLQNWSLVCAIIEIVVECITMLVYGVVFYRFWSKRKLRRTMAVRDKARSELYMSQMRSGMNTPGLPMSPSAGGFPGAPLSPREGGYNPMYSPRFASKSADSADAAERGEAVSEGAQFASLSSALHSDAPKQFQLSKPPMKSPKITVQHHGASSDSDESKAPAVTHVPAAPAEPQYGAVPIPGAYTSPLTSPTVAGSFQRMT